MRTQGESDLTGDLSGVAPPVPAEDLQNRIK